jgi:hypothetical protein
MKKLLILVALAVLLFAQPFSSIHAAPQPQGDPVLAKVIDIGRNDNQTTRWLDVLTNRFGPRVSGTDAYNNAAQWAVQQFKSWGLQAELQEAGEVPDGVLARRILREDDRNTRQHSSSPHLRSPPARRAASRAGRRPARRNGAGRSDEGKAQGRGSWRRADRTQSQRDAGRARPHLQDARGRRRSAPSSRGAKMPWRLSANRIASWDQIPRMPEITLLEMQYDEITAAAAGGQKVELEFEVRNYFKMGPVKYYNVIAWLPGTQSQDPAVILSGHLDSVSGSAGATDDLSGSTPAMEALRILAKAGVRPKRTIMTHLFAAEELGILGTGV